MRGKGESANRLLEQIAAQTDTVEGNEVANSGYIGAAADREKIVPEINLIQTDPIGLLLFPAAADMSPWRATAFRAKWVGRDGPRARAETLIQFDTTLRKLAVRSADRNGRHCCRADAVDQH
jgi:hypothetical protein